MINRIRLLIRNSILQNIFSLSLGELISKLIALITFAYLARILSPDGFGIIGFATAFISYFVTFADFGLDTYGTRQLAKDQNELAFIFSSIQSTRILTSIISLIALITFVIISFENEIQKAVILVMSLSIITSAISVNWYFQGIQRMQYIGIKQIVISLLSLALVILLVHSEADVVNATLALTISGIIISVPILCFFYNGISKINFSFNYRLIISTIKESSPLALSSFMILIYYNLDLVMLGILKSDYDVGIYSASVKIFLLGNIAYQIIQRAYFPELVKAATHYLSKVFKNYFILMIICGLVISAIIFIYSENIITLLFGIKYTASVWPLYILAVNSMVVCLNMIFCNPLIAWGKQNYYLLIVSAGALSNIMFNILLIPTYSYMGAAFATLISETVVFSIAIIIISRKFNRKMLKDFIQ